MTLVTGSIPFFLYLSSWQRCLPNSWGGGLYTRKSTAKALNLLPSPSFSQNLPRGQVLSPVSTHMGPLGRKEMNVAVKSSRKSSRKCPGNRPHPPTWLSAGWGTPPCLTADSAGLRVMPPHMQHPWPPLWALTLTPLQMSKSGLGKVGVLSASSTLTQVF